MTPPVSTPHPSTNSSNILLSESSAAFRPGASERFCALSFAPIGSPSASPNDSIQVAQINVRRWIILDRIQQLSTSLCGLVNVTNDDLGERIAASLLQRI